MPIERRLWLSLALALPMGVAQAQAETIQVVIDKLTFSPAVITAKAGDTIEWVNKDALAHTATVKGRMGSDDPIEEDGCPNARQGGDRGFLLPLPSEHEGQPHSRT